MNMKDYRGQRQDTHNMTTNKTKTRREAETSWPQMLLRLLFSGMLRRVL